MRMKRKGRARTITQTKSYDHDSNSDDVKVSTTKRRRLSRLLPTSSTNDRDVEQLEDNNTPTIASSSNRMVDENSTRITNTSHPSPLLLHQKQLPILDAVSIASNSDISTTSPSLLFLHNWIHHTDISFHYFSSSEIQQIQSKLLQWYSIHRRKLPWRGDPPPWNGSTVNFILPSTTTTSSSLTTTKSTKARKITNPTKNIKVTATPDASMDDSYMHRTYPITTYGIWVSEIMLQQTRVEAVIVKWCQFMSTFPNVTALANAKLDNVNAIWAGLGYYRRLKLLHTAAQMVVTKYNGIIPTTIEGLLTLPGIGRYTAHAIASIAYHHNVPVVDGNVCRVLSRLRGVAQTIKASTFKDQYGWTLAQQLVSNVGQNYSNSTSLNVATTTTAASTTPQVISSSEDIIISPATTFSDPTGVAGDINQALMELGATYCAPSGTGIHPDDPLKEFYWSTKLGIALSDAMNCKTNDETVSSLNSILANKTSITEKDTDGQPHCQLCAKHGVHDIVSQFRNQLMASKLKLPSDNEVYTSNIVDSSYQDMVQQLGHSLFPLPPPTVNKKEEVIVIAAICRFCNDSNNESNATKQWLLVKRQDDGGLLSGQWEFPSISVWQSEDEQKSKSKGGSGRRSTPRIDMSDRVPLISIPQRRKYIHTLLTSLGGHINSSLLQTITDDPIHHIFSHIRHTMYIEYTCVDSDWTYSDDDDTKDQSVLKEWKSQTDMELVGITSGVKKVLQTIEKKVGNSLMP